MATLAFAAPLALCAGAASAEDTLKLVIGQINNWENQAPTLGQDAGIFKKHGLVLENTGTAGAGETIQPVISGSRRYRRRRRRGRRHARLLQGRAGAHPGAGFYRHRRPVLVRKADSPIKSLKDATAANTIAYSTNGSSSNNIVVAFVRSSAARPSRRPPAAPPPH